MKNKSLLIICLVLVLSLLGACAKPAPTPAPAPAPAPAQPADVITWKIQGSFEPAHFNHVNAVIPITEGVTEASGGRLVFKAFAGGGIAPILKELDGVDKNMLDGCYTCTMYNTDKWAAASLYSGFPGALSAEAFRIWYNQGGGYELLVKLVEGYNVLPLPGAQPQPPEVFLHATKPIESLADMKGLRIRAAGDGGPILNAMGASVVTMSGSECYEAVQRGVLDAFELAGPAVDWSLRAQEIADYMLMSDIRAPSDALIFYVNKTSWEKLPDDLRQIVMQSVQTYTQLAHEKVTQENVIALQKFIDYGVNVSHAPLDVEEAMLKEAEKFYNAKMEKEDPIYREIMESQRAFKKAYSSYAALNTPWATQ